MPSLTAVRIAVSTLHHYPCFLQGFPLLAKPLHFGSHPVLIKVVEKVQWFGQLLFVTGEGRDTLVCD